ncbi:MAG: T9SS type A sorting domain-containing protein [FCB group bacterium]|jgi:WD40 repeat protein
MKLKIVLIVILTLASVQAWSQDNYFKDTVWTNRIEDQKQGFYMVKFSHTDSLIVAHGYSQDLFLDAKTGQEIKRIDGNNEIFFINNDLNFIRLNQARNKFEIFDAKTYKVIDSIENDSIKIPDYIYPTMSKDERYIVSPILHGFRIWDLQTKRILKTKIYPKPNEENLIDYTVTYIQFLCDDTKLIGQYVKTYQNQTYPYNQYSAGSYIVYDINTLDSIDNYINSSGFRISNTCKYIVSATGDPDYGIEVYDFKTKMLLWKLPVNGPSLTGIEFSPDDKYLVTTNNFSALMRIWNLVTSKPVYNYNDGGYENFDISHNGEKIITSIGEYLLLYPAKYNGTPVNENPDSIKQIIYPNPTSGKAIIYFVQPDTEKTTIDLIDLSGRIINNLYNKLLDSGNQNIEVDVSLIVNGTYFIKVQNSHLSLLFKLIINK